MLLPASTGSGESDLVCSRLDEVLPVVSVVAVLSCALATYTPEVVLAVLEMLVVREESTFTTRVTDLLAPARSEERRVGKTRGARGPPEVEETKLVSAGSGWERLARGARNGQLV